MKRLKIILLFIAVCLFTSVGFAQEEASEKKMSLRLGAKLGYNVMTNVVFTGTGDSDIYEWEPTRSPIIGLTSELMFTRKFGIQIEAQYTRKGFTTKPLFDFTQKVSMLEIPMYLKIADLEGSFLGDMFVGDDINSSVLVGPIYGINTGTFLREEGDKESFDISDTDIKRTHWGLGIYAVAEANIDEKHRVGIQIGGKLSITDVDKDPDFSRYFRSLDISLIYYLPI